jgi:hypothetical protein
MPAVASPNLPSLSQIQSWDTSHLTSAATHWRANATRWEDAATEIYQQMGNPGGRIWEGRAAEAAQQRAHDDRMKIIGVADELHAASDLAHEAANELEVAKRRVTSLVAEARASGLTVNDDLSVEYLDDGSTAAAAKRAKALEFATKIRTGAVQLAALDQRVAAGLTAAASNVTALDFPETPPSVPSPKDPDTTGLLVRDAEDVHKVVDPLPPGRQPHVKVVPTPETLRGLFETLTTNSTPAPPNSYPGDSRLLEDGTRISYRPESKSGGATIDIAYPDKSVTKIHVEELPKPPPSPVPVPAPAPAPVVVPAQEPDPDFSPSLGLPTPTIGAPALAPEDVGVLGTLGAIGIGILAGIGSFGKWVLSP